MEDTISPSGCNDMAANFGTMSTQSNPLDQSLASTAQSSTNIGGALADDDFTASPMIESVKKTSAQETSLSNTTDKGASKMTTDDKPSS